MAERDVFGTADHAQRLATPPQEVKSPLLPPNLLQYPGPVGIVRVEGERFFIILDGRLFVSGLHIGFARAIIDIS
jgi:hypothetical protein